MGQEARERIVVGCLFRSRDTRFRAAVDHIARVHDVMAWQPHITVVLTLRIILVLNLGYIL
jgi:hypothetical protein